jgi:trehalose synthase
MPALLEAYAEVAGTDIIGHLQQLTATLRGVTVVHVNSTRVMRRRRDPENCPADAEQG